MIRARLPRRLSGERESPVAELRVARLIEERPEPMRVPRLWSTRALSEHWGVHRLTIYRAFQAGRLPGYRVLGCLRFLESDVLSLLHQAGVPVEDQNGRDA